MADQSVVVAVDSEAPDFSLESSDGTLIRLWDYRHQAHLVLYFMREFT